MKKTAIKNVLAATTMFFSLTVNSSCKSSDLNNSPSTGIETPVKMVSRLNNEVSVMSYNVENMFDNIHNQGVGDYTYLPLAQKNNPEVIQFCSAMADGFFKDDCFNKNWNDAAVDFKISQIAKVISFVDNGNGPDNLLLAEVENENILKMLVNKYLSKFGYQTVVILKGPDPRGINTAFISKFPMVGSPKIHLIPYTDPKALKSRGILEATVKIKNKNVTFLAAHFPSQSNPTEWRAEAMEHMKNLMLDLEKSGHAVIAGGDLNTIPAEETNYGFFSKTLSQAGDVSHLVGCSSCQGSHFYRGEWTFLDVLIFGKNLTQDGNLTLIPDSIQVIRTPVNSTKSGIPIRFDEVKRVGASDHLPMYARLKLK